MSKSTTADGLRIAHKGKADHRISKGNVGARTEPKFEHGDVSLWRFNDGQRYTLFMSIDEAYDLADALDALLAYIEETGYAPTK
jgi:hypothetical protein